MNKYIYQLLIIMETITWWLGIKKSLHLSGECHVDFSCCYPEMYIKSFKERTKCLIKILKQAYWLLTK